MTPKLSYTLFRVLNLKIIYGELRHRTEKLFSLYHNLVGAWLPKRLRRWSNKPDVVGSIPVTTTECFLISCDSNQVPKSFETHYKSGGPIITLVKWCCSAGKSVFGVAPAIVQWTHYVAYV